MEQESDRGLRGHVLVGGEGIDHELGRTRPEQGVPRSQMGQGFFQGNHRVPHDQEIAFRFPAFDGIRAGLVAIVPVGCRFFHPDLAGTITRTGQWILLESKRFLESQGYRVLYGDTDSLFVHAPAADGVEALRAVGRGWLRT